MNKCKNCNIEILDDTDTCPLCKSVLMKENDGVAAYPDARVRTKRMRFISNIMLFVMVVAISLVTYVNYKTYAYNSMLWSLIVDGGIALAYMEFRIIVISYEEYITKFFKSIILCVLYMILIDNVIGYTGWSVDYMVPIAIIIACIGVVVLMILDRHNWQSYLMYQIFIVFCGVMALILMLFDINTKPILCQAAFGFSFFLFIGTVIIGDRKAKSELARRFHIK